MRDGVAGRESLHGTAVLAEMLRQRGCQVATLTSFSRRLDDFTVVLWFPDDFSAPSEVQRQMIRDWLCKAPQRRWIFIGRDYNAVPRYSESILGQAADARRLWLFRAHSLLQHESRRVSSPSTVWPGLFRTERLPAARPATGIVGHSGWKAGVDLAGLDVALAERLVLFPQDAQAGDMLRQTGQATAEPSHTPTGEHRPYQPNSPANRPKSSNGQPWHKRVLVDSDEGPLVVQFWEWDYYGKLLVVANGSLLMNAGLVNRSNRQLVEKILAECGEGQKVAFLLTDERDRQASPSDDSRERRRAQWFFAWPLGVVLAHILLGAAGFVWMYFPIFGKAYDTQDGSSVEFARHLQAMGELLRATGERQFADDCISAYLERKREKQSAGKSLHENRQPAPTADDSS